MNEQKLETITLGPWRVRLYRVLAKVLPTYTQTVATINYQAGLQDGLLAQIARIRMDGKDITSLLGNGGGTETIQ